jgi:hypothetical protein
MKHFASIHDALMFDKERKIMTLCDPFFSKSSQNYNDISKRKKPRNKKGAMSNLESVCSMSMSGMAGAKGISNAVP